MVLESAIYSFCRGLLNSNLWVSYLFTIDYLLQYVCVCDGGIYVIINNSTIVHYFISFSTTIPFRILHFRSSQSAFYKVLISNAATSALRLHQRLPGIQFTREFLSLLLLEDSCHYLFFSLIFLYVQPVILVLFPVVLFAVLHSASYSLKMLDVSFTS